jgi:hypothetical protein
MSDIHVKLMTSLLMPFILSLILLIYNGMRNKKFSLFQFLMNFYLAFFIFNETIFSRLIDVTACKSFEFDDNYTKSYLRNYLGIECFDDHHYFWIYFIIIPFFIFYGVLIPISILVLAYLKKDEIYQEKNVFKYDFMMRQPFQSKNASIW